MILIGAKAYDNIFYKHILKQIKICIFKWTTFQKILFHFLFSLGYGLCMFHAATYLKNTLDAALQMISLATNVFQVIALSSQTGYNRHISKSQCKAENALLLISIYMSNEQTFCLIFSFVYGNIWDIRYQKNISKDGLVSV